MDQHAPAVWRGEAAPAAHPGRLPLVYPAFRRLPPPVIVIGMHRSGTSLAAGMLSVLGVFMGPRLRLPAADPVESGALRSSGYGEAAAFYRLNERLLAQAGAGWNRIEPFLELREDACFERRAVRALQLATFGSLRTGYLGSLQAAGTAAWGWKDPRNSLTVDYWLRLFPEARLLHVRRELTAAADSLHRRAWEWVQAPPPASSPVRLLLRWIAGRPAPPSPDPCLDRGYCLALAARYVDECLRWRSLEERYLEVRYEDLVAHPAASADQLAWFARAPVFPQALRAAAALVERR